MAQALLPQVLAAGVALVRDGLDGPEVAIVHRPRRRDWSLPKGKADPGEHVITAAARECFEETGLRPILGVPLRTQNYRVFGRTKSVYYWAARVESGTFKANAEVDSMMWIPAHAADKVMTYPRDAKLVEEAIAAPRTSPLILMRHATAMKRADWQARGGGDKRDPRRPLNNLGRREATSLVDVLAAYGITQVHTSSSERCSATVRPFATAARLPVHEEPVLSEEGHDIEPKASTDRFLELLADPRPLVVCSHRPVLPDLETALSSATGSTLPNRPLAPGAFIVAHRRLEEDGSVGKIASVEWHAPPPLG